jgi:hypothetical protein
MRASHIVKTGLVGLGGFVVLVLVLVLALARGPRELVQALLEPAPSVSSEATEGAAEAPAQPAEVAAADVAEAALLEESEAAEREETPERQASTEEPAVGEEAPELVEEAVAEPPVAARPAVEVRQTTTSSSATSSSRSGAGSAPAWQPGDADIGVRGVEAVRELLHQGGLLLVHTSVRGELVSVYDVTYLRKPGGTDQRAPARVHDLDTHLGARGLLDAEQGWVHARLRGDPEVLEDFAAKFKTVVRRNEPDLAEVHNPQHSLWLVLPPKTYDHWVSSEIPRLLAEHPASSGRPQVEVRYAEGGLRLEVL